MRQRRGTWLTVASFVLALSACEDEILTDVDIPKDASADRGSDAPKEGATGDAPAPTDSGPDENPSTGDAGTLDEGDSGRATDGGDARSTGDAADATDVSLDVNIVDGALGD